MCIYATAVFVFFRIQPEQTNKKGAILYNEFPALLVLVIDIQEIFL